MKMSQKEFVEKTKSVLEKIQNAYLQSWKNRVLRDEERLKETVCIECTGCGFFLENGEQKDCFQDREQGNCFHRFCDNEEVVMYLENQLGNISDLLSVDEIVDTKNDDGSCV